MKTTTIIKTRISNWRKRLVLASARNESGAALVVALLLLVVIAVAVPVAMNMTSQDFGRTTNYTDSKELFYLAEAGLEHTKSLIRKGNIDIILAGPDGDRSLVADNGTLAGVGDSPDDTPYVWNGLPYDDVTFSGGTYYLRVFDNDDGDGDLFSDTDNLIFIDSVGVNANGDTKTLRAMVRLYNPDFPGAVSFGGPVTMIEVEGIEDADDDHHDDSDGHGDFDFLGAHPDSGYGYGFAIDGTSDVNCTAKAGISTESAGPVQYLVEPDDDDDHEDDHADCTSATCIELEDGAGPNIQGMGGTTPNVTTDQTTFTQAEALEMWTSLTAPGVPDYTTVVDGGAYGTASNPAIVHISGAEILDSKNITGTGILIIDSESDEMEFEGGSLQWNGIVLVNACPTCAALEELEFEDDANWDINGGCHLYRT